MDLLVKKFTLRHNGTDYGPGTLVKGVSAVEGEEILRVADGDVARLDTVADGDVVRLDTEVEAGGAKHATAAKKGLPPVDPKATVGRRK